jgi:di/tricarboxylate transporter
MEFTWAMGLCLTLMASAVVLFVWEKIPADVTALLLMGALLLAGVLQPKEAFIVFSNEAPLTVAAMFVLSAALLKTGAMDVMSGLLSRTAGHSEIRSLVVIFIVAGLASAFINNTPVVAVLMPVVLRHARNHGIPVSQLLMPLSFAAVLGGCCTLIGTSTNLVVHGMAQARGLAGFGMFELAWIGVPLVVAGTIYTVWAAPRLLPRRETLTSLLKPEELKPTLVQIMVQRHSPLIGLSLKEISWLADTRIAGIRILEMRRRGVRLTDELRTVKLEELDRLTLAVESKCLQRDGSTLTLVIDGKPEKEWGFETLSTVDGRIVETVVAPQSPWKGQTLRRIRPRSEYGVQILAMHRNGKNLTRTYLDLPLHAGDTLLLLGSVPAIEQVSQEDQNLILLEEHEEPPELEAHQSRWAGFVAAGLVLAVVVTATLGWLPISVAAIAACGILLLTRVLEPKEAYGSIDWRILMIICGTMSLGVAMEATGTASWIASHSVGVLEGLLRPEILPWAMLAFFVITTSVFTEFASNNGAAALMVPLAIESAKHLDVSPMPFLVAVTISASAAFATPIGYQTNTMVYGAGGYTFRDFLRMGTPLNLISWAIQIGLIPFVWKF